jgi:hypothetical protein
MYTLRRPPPGKNLASAAAAATRVAKLRRCGENALMLPVLTLLQEVAVTAHHGELPRQRVLRFVLRLSFVLLHVPVQTIPR